MLYPSFLKSENSASIFIIFLKTDEFFTALPQIIDTIFSCRHPLIIRYPHSLISQTDLSVHHICGNRMHHIISQNHFATELSVSQFVFGNPTHFFRSYNQIVILYFIFYIVYTRKNRHDTDCLSEHHVCFWKTSILLEALFIFSEFFP